MKDELYKRLWWILAVIMKHASIASLPIWRWRTLNSNLLLDHQMAIHSRAQSMDAEVRFHLF